jgi:hypothetical protein
MNSLFRRAELIPGVFAVRCVSNKDCDEWRVHRGPRFLGPTLVQNCTTSVTPITLC